MKMGDRIRQMRIDAGMTQEELAEKLGLQKSAIAKYENGRVENIKRSTIQKMAELFDRTPSYVMGFTDTSDYNSDNSSAPIVRIPVLGYVTFNTNATRNATRNLKYSFIYLYQTKKSARKATDELVKQSKIIYRVQ